MMGSLKNAGSMASSVMAAGIQRVGEKVRALSGSTALTKQDLHAMHTGNRLFSKQYVFTFTIQNF